MKIGAILATEVQPSALPGKLLMDLSDKPLLEYIVDRVKQCPCVERVVVAASLEENDDAVADYCTRNGIFCYRGSPDRVASRFYQVLEVFKWDGFVRLRPDSPLIDPQLIEEATGQLDKGTFDVVTNIFPPRFPEGQTVEAVRSDIYIKAFVNFSTREEFNEVTKYFYENPTSYRIYNLEADGDYHQIKMRVNSKQDLQALTRVVNQMDWPHWQYGWKELMNLQQKAHADGSI